MGTWPWQAREVRQRVQRQIHLRRRSAKPVALNILDEVVRQLARLDEPEKGQARIDAGRDDPPADLVAVFQHDAVGLIPADENARHLSLRADLYTSGAGGAGDRVGDRPGA